MAHLSPPPWSRNVLPICLLIACIGLCPAHGAPATTVAQTAGQRDERMKWFREARFGMFIHWGLYAIPAGEWKGKPVKGIGEWIMHYGQIPVAEYEALAAQFNPVKFDAAQWVQIAKDAGMKYIVITSKHHDGFALFDSKVSDYDAMATPLKRDLLKELADAARAEGIRICWYHSIMDWHHPDAQAPNFPNYNNRKAAPNPNRARYREDFLKPQLRELLTNYGEIGILWFDGEWIPDWTEQQGRDLYAFCRSLQPSLIINNRVGKGREGMKGMTKEGQFAGDYGTPEQEVPPTGFPGVDWESCMTMNGTWGFKANDHNWKSDRRLIHTLIETASKGGNFLLNVGPTAAGEIPQPSIDRLAAIGRWMKTNGESIYGTTASPFPQDLDFGRCTQKPGKLFLHVTQWPATGSVALPLRNAVKTAYLLAAPDQPLGVSSTDAGLTITLPAQAPDPIASVIVLEIDGQAQVIPAAAAPAD